MHRAFHKPPIIPSGRSASTLKRRIFKDLARLSSLDFTAGPEVRWDVCVWGGRPPSCFIPVPGAPASGAPSRQGHIHGGTRDHLRCHAPGIRRSGAHPESRTRHLENPDAPEAADHRVLPGADGQRRDRGVHRLSRPIQHHARPGQGRHPVSPGRVARRGHRARRVDDLEVRRRAHSVRRRQGRHHLRPDAHVAARARGAHAPLHRRDHRRHRARQGRARARRQHQRADHGVDHGHLLHARRPHRDRPS